MMEEKATYETLRTIKKIFHLVNVFLHDFASRIVNGNLIIYEGFTLFI